MSIFKSSGFTSSSINGKTINTQAYNAYYDNETGMIKTFNNGEIKDFIFDKKDVDEILKSYFNNQLQNTSSQSLLNKLGSDYDISIEPKEYSNSLKNVDSKLKNLFTDISKVGKNKTKKAKTKAKAKGKKKTLAKKK